MQNNGAGNMYDRPMSACVYSKFMEFWGFTKVYEGFGPSSEGFKPEPGDIAVIAGTRQKKHGHIHICVDTNLVDDKGNKIYKWYSDFACNTPWCYRDKGRPYIVYRWIEENVSNA